MAKWSSEEERFLINNYSWMPWPQLEEELPNRTRDAIHHKAIRIGLNRNKTVNFRGKIGDLIIDSLKERRLSLNMSLRELGIKIGFNDKWIGNWERGISSPNYFGLKCWCEGLGLKLSLKTNENALSKFTVWHLENGEDWSNTEIWAVTPRDALREASLKGFKACKIYDERRQEWYSPS